MGKPGPAGFGFRKKDGKVFVEPEEAKVCRLTFDLFLEHSRKKTVADELNAQGIRTRSGTLFTGQAISRILSDKRLCGIAGTVPAIIPKDTFEKAELILQRQKRKGGISRKPRYLLAGRVYCACGGKMYVPSRSRKYVCRACLAKIPILDLEAIVASQLRLDDDGVNTDKAIIAAAERWTELSFDARFQLIEATIFRVEIDHNKVKISRI